MLHFARISFKASETLLGIETYAYEASRRELATSFKASETLLGIETHEYILVRSSASGLQSL